VLPQHHCRATWSRSPRLPSNPWRGRPRSAPPRHSRARVAIRAGLAVEHALQRHRIGVGIAAAQRLAVDAAEPGVFRRHLEGADSPFSKLATKTGTGEGDFIEPSEPCTTQTDSEPRFFSTCASGCTQCREKTPTICRLTPAGLESGPSRLKIVRVASSTGSGRRFHRGMMRGRKHEADAGFLDAAADLVRRKVDPDAERGQHVGSPEREDSARCRCLATGTPAPADE